MRIIIGLGVSISLVAFGFLLGLGYASIEPTRDFALNHHATSDSLSSFGDTDRSWLRYSATPIAVIAATCITFALVKVVQRERNVRYKSPHARDGRLA